MSMYAERPKVDRLRALTPDEVGERLRYCDSCHAEQLFGCTARLNVGWHYAQLCKECLEALADGAVKATAKEVPGE